MTKPVKKPTWCGLPIGTTVVVDTAPFIYVLEANPHFASLFTGLFEAEQKGELFIALSTMTLAEVLTSPYKASQFALAKRYETELTRFKVIPVTAAISVLAAQLRAQYRLKLPDALQMATALDTGAAALVTHDRDFSAVTGMVVLMGEAS